MTNQEAMKLARSSLKELVAQVEGRLFSIKHDHFSMQDARSSIRRLEEALAKQEQGEPVAWYIREKDTATTDDSWIHEHPEMVEPLYLHPQQRKPLTDEQIMECAWGLFEDANSVPVRYFARAIEAAHKIKE